MGGFHRGIGDEGRGFRKRGEVVEEEEEGEGGGRRIELIN